MERIKINLHESLWADGMQRCVRVRERAIEEIKEYLENDEEMTSERSNAAQQVKALFMSIINVVKSRNDGVAVGSNDGFYQFVRENLISNEAEVSQLPVPVYSFIKPTMGVQFLLHVMLSMGRFANEID